MPSRSPLRRLSVALRLAEAYQPPDAPAVALTTTTSLSLFLINAKANFLKDVKEDEAKAADWIVVMGNEAGDLDTIASSIAYAWIQSEIYKKPAVPLLHIHRNDFVLRAENLHALKLAGLSPNQEELLTLDDLSQYQPFPARKFALVDHNCLADAFTHNNPQAHVVAIIDHHHDEGHHLDANPRVVTPCGSCASHIASLCPPEIPAELATLLLSAILIDTDGLVSGGKATSIDREAALILAPKTTFGNTIPPPSALSPIDHPNPDALSEVQSIKDLTSILAEKKADVSHLGGLDLLRRDYKEYSHKLLWATGQPTIKVGLSTVPTGLKSWATDGRLEKAAVEWMKRRGLTILGVLTSFRDAKKTLVGKNKKGKHKREMAWIILETSDLAKTSSDGLTASSLARRLWKGLEANAEIEVRRHKKFDMEKSEGLPKNSQARVYKQGNASATRKAIAPLVKEILEGNNVKPAEEAKKQEEPTPTSTTKT
ncbi:hypothetical protein CVT25_003537 [Psilocybe cyanescens]|uniref:DHHA2 domain-containing protein n=1 Tax=Psilocybe cyanescens TaxID=93625 RepID=A0A409X6Q1_PSICY|nr:hypothetical protein CVT25_003537 [Psilocybe cyanescens]